MRAAEVLSAAGEHVHLFDQMPSVGRKFLVAGKSGLNLTNAAEEAAFLSRYTGTTFPETLWAEIYRQFTNDDLRAWANSHGQDTFISSGKKVFPASMKAAPLLRAWVAKLKQANVQFHMRHQLVGINAAHELNESDSTQELTFATPAGEKKEQFAAVFFALGGASWQRTGSDGKWVSVLQKLDLEIEPLTAANCGWEVAWDQHFIQQYSGQPIKNVSCSAGEQAPEADTIQADAIVGEFVVTDYGIEGGPIYRLGSEIKKLATPALTLDFKPTFSVQQLTRKMESVKRDFLDHAQQRWKLSAVVVDLLRAHGPSTYSSAEELATVVKAFSLPLLHPRPIDEAISSAGGMQWSELNPDLSLKKFPNLYLCGEMLNWEAPTGGYLLQGCFATATFAANAYLKNQRP